MAAVLFTSTVYVQIFEVHNFRSLTIFRIFTILFSRIAFHSEKFAVLFSRIACPQSLNAAEIACLCIVTLMQANNNNPNVTSFSVNASNEMQAIK